MNDVKELPLVSIVIPCYNSGRFVGETIASVLGQTYSNWECILIDDHSADDTFSIISEYASKYPEKFKVLANSGKGACDARNMGIEQSSGVYIKFLDSDDVLFDESTLMSQVTFALDSKRDIVYGIEHYYKDNFNKESFIKSRGEPLSPDNINTHYFYNRPITSNFLASKGRLKDIRWDNTLRSGQEFNFLFVCFIAGLTFGYQDVPVIKIRAHNSPHRISHKPRKLYMDEKLVLIKSMCRIVERYNYRNSDFLAAFNLWMMDESYLALRAKNLSVFKALQALLASPATICVPRTRIGYFYRMNSFAPMLSFVVTQVLRKVFKLELQ